MADIFQTVAALGVVPVIAIERVEDALPLADALLEGGLPVAEITFRTEAAAAVLATLRDRRPELLLGAGTVLDEAAVKAAVAAGARFGLAPGFDPAVVAAAAAAGLPFAPGFMTPSELSLALRRGVRVAKFFPAAAAGGPALLEAIAAPFAHLNVRFIPTGGVSAQNLPEWLKIPAVAAVGGTWIARGADLRAGRWAEIAARARAAVAAARACREAVA